MSERLRKGALVAAAIAAAVATVVFLTAVARHTRYGSSDNANAVLAGQAMLHGNPLLADWKLPHNSYWLLDLPVFGLASVIFGMGDVALAAVPATIDTLAIILGSMVAVIGLRNRRTWWVAPAVLLILLGLPHNYLVLFILQGPHHVATAVACLGAFALLARAGIGGVRWLVAVGLLAVAAHSDPEAIAVGIVPVAAAGALDALRSRRIAAAAGPLAAAVAALGGSFVLSAVLHAAGGYQALPDPPLIGAWRENLGAVPRILRGLLGPAREGHLSGGALAARTVGAALFAIAIVASMLRSAAGLIRPPSMGGAGTGAEAEPGVGQRRDDSPSADWLDDALLLGFAGGLAVFAVLSDPALQTFNARYLLPSLVFGGVLTARRAVEATAQLPGPAVAAGALALAIAYLPTPLEVVRTPAPENPTVAVARWLDGQGFRQGFGQYWVAGLTTVSGGGSVAIRPVKAVDGTLRANEHFASERWFRADRPFRFVVLDTAQPDGVDEAVAAATFGVPAEAHDIGRYRVLIWDRDLTVAYEP